MSLNTSKTVENVVTCEKMKNIFPCKRCFKENKICSYSDISSPEKVLLNYDHLPLRFNKAGKNFTEKFDLFLKVQPKYGSSYEGTIPHNLGKKVLDQFDAFLGGKRFNGFFEQYLSYQFDENTVNLTKEMHQELHSGEEEAKVESNKKYKLNFHANPAENFDVRAAITLMNGSSGNLVDSRRQSETFENTRFTLPSSELLESIHWFAAHFYTQFDFRSDQKTPNIKNLSNFDMFYKFKSNSLLSIGILIQEYIRHLLNNLGEKKIQGDALLTDKQCHYAPTNSDFVQESLRNKTLINRESYLLKKKINLTKEKESRIKSLFSFSPEIDSPFIYEKSNKADKIDAEVVDIKNLEVKPQKKQKII
ncbi:hypothetical protein HDU92_006209 [Lobulomyces angularis]|nr:hypothetical protein HDU92_006209 [Lobulomyces angularis]